MTDKFNFTNNWFDVGAKGFWDQLIPQINPSKILEIGSYEGAASCYLINKVAANIPIEMHCVDTWSGGIEHQQGGMAHADMNSVETLFRQNIELAKKSAVNNVNLFIHKGLSEDCLSKLIADGKKNYFDFIYVDGSHQAPDVLCDAIMSFKLLKIGGVMAFDDYLWHENLPYGKDPLRCPKPAIDAFVNINFRKLNILSAPLYQLYIQKISD